MLDEYGYTTISEFHNLIKQDDPLYKKLLADATRYRWLRKYMASSRTDLDDALVEACSSDNPDELDVMIDLYEAIEKGGV